MVTWQTSIRLLFLEKIRVLKWHDDWKVHSPSTEMRVPSIVMTTDFIKWNRIVKYSRNNIYLRDDFTCKLCNTKMPINDLTLDHILPRSKGGKTVWKNVVTCCKRCNSSKGNDETIVPAILPEKPTYYELSSKRKKYPIYIKDMEWNYYLGWPEDLVKIIPITSPSQRQ